MFRGEANIVQLSIATNRQHELGPSRAGRRSGSSEGDQLAPPPPVGDLQLVGIVCGETLRADGHDPPVATLPRVLRHQETRHVHVVLQGSHLAASSPPPRLAEGTMDHNSACVKTHHRCQPAHAHTHTHTHTHTLTLTHTRTRHSTYNPERSVPCATCCAIFRLVQFVFVALFRITLTHDRI